MTEKFFIILKSFSMFDAALPVASPEKSISEAEYLQHVKYCPFQI